MSWRKVVFVLVFCLITGITSYALAGCPNVVGDWDMTIRWAYYDEASRKFGYKNMVGIIRIKNQNGCHFYGQVEIPSDPHSGCPVTGIVNLPKSVTMTSCDTILNCTLTNYKSTTGKFTGMRLSGSNVDKGDGADFQGTFKGSAKRR